MLKVTIDTNVVVVSYINSKSEVIPRKRFNCPHCEAEVAYYNYSPLSCPVCKKGFADLDKLMDTRTYGRIAFFQGKLV
jgi:hypothetical protein